MQGSIVTYSSHLQANMAQQHQHKPSCHAREARHCTSTRQKAQAGNDHTSRCAPSDICSPGVPAMVHEDCCERTAICKQRVVLLLFAPQTRRRHFVLFAALAHLAKPAAATSPPWSARMRSMASSSACRVACNSRCTSLISSVRFVLPASGGQSAVGHSVRLCTSAH
jgi:hypothetical protein